MRDIAGLLEVKLIDAADFAVEGERAWIERMVEQVLTHEGVLDIENVENLPQPSSWFSAAFRPEPRRGHGW
ncbi:MAG: hypothetical protein EOP32_18160 [Rhodococcus sp. (in: high G+C Gram-positive bacteria)]|nr:MAG: hypothetical protein EOP32_18160 [Rhodococcus sp. (in: high G+C Gram-positive bacteria)]